MDDSQNNENPSTQIKSSMDLDLKIRNLYQSHFNDVKYYVLKNSGTVEDCRDLFQEVALVYFNQLKKPSFELTSSEKTYILAVARNLWLKKIRDTRPTFQPSEDWLNNIEDVSIDEIQQSKTKNDLLDYITNAIETIGTECKEIILMAFFQKKSAADIAMATGYAEGFIKVKKHRCLQGLKKMVFDSGQFKNYLATS